VLLFVLTAAILGSASLAGAQSGMKLRQRQHALATTSRSALLGLYALDSRLAQARAELARTHARIVSLRAEQQRVRAELVVVAHNLLASQRLLAQHLLSLYEQGEPNAIAILLGSSSLDDAVTRLNDAEQSARQGQDVFTDAQRGRAKLAELAAALAASARDARRLENRARATTAALANARAARVAYLGTLARRRRLNARELAALDAHAHAVVERAQAVQSNAAAPAPAASERSASITVTATGYSLAGHTSTGLPVGPGVVAVDPSVIPLGTRMTIPGYGEGVAADTGGGVSGNTIDLWFPSLADAMAWGRRTVTITLH
jgi:3D (Asp-Asp-Asp) domain-containing protein